MEYSDAEKVMAKAEEKFPGMVVNVVSLPDSPTINAGVTMGAQPLGEEPGKVPPQKRSYCVAVDFTGPIPAEILDHLREIAIFAVMPTSEGARIMFNKVAS